MSTRPPRPWEPVDSQMRAFLDDVAEHPEDAGARLIFADWLEDRGDPRAELMRMQAACLEGESQGVEERLEAWLTSRTQRSLPTREAFEGPTAYPQCLIRGDLYVDEENVREFLEAAEWQGLRDLLREGWIREFHLHHWNNSQLGKAAKLGLLAGPSELGVFNGPSRSLELLGHCGQLRKLWVCHDQERATDEELLHLAGLTKLREFGYPYAHRVGAGLAHLSKWPQLRKLELRDAGRLEKAAFVHVGALAGLEQLNLRSCGTAKDAWLVHFTGLTNLRELEMDGNDWLTDAGLAHLARLANLENLTLSECRGITDAGLAHLTGLTRLKHLELAFCDQLTGAGFAHLQALKSLEWLLLQGCKLKSHDTRALRKALPNCRVSRG